MQPQGQSAAQTTANAVDTSGTLSTLRSALSTARSALNSAASSLNSAETALRATANAAHTAAAKTAATNAANDADEDEKEARKIYADNTGTPTEPNPDDDQRRTALTDALSAVAGGLRQADIDLRAAAGVPDGRFWNGSCRVSDSGGRAAR